ncbi:RHS repeat-associated core domain-containing protein [Pseudomonas azerbaijanoccidentalis]
MLPDREMLLCRYVYDPLDRLVDCTPSTQAIARRFYLKDRLTTEIQGAVQRSIMRHGDLLLAQQQGQSGILETRLLATDQQRSVLNVLDATRLNSLAYSPYGHRPAENGLLSLLGFNGEQPDPVTGCYLLGNGYRAFGPVLMRFNSPDSWSPFGEGGLNAYSYCEGDPRNRSDSNGHLSLSPLAKSISSFLDNLPFRKSSPTILKNNKMPASSEFLTGTYKQRDHYKPRINPPSPGTDKNYQLYSANQTEKELVQTQHTPINNFTPHAQRPLNNDADPLKAQLKKLLNRYNPSKASTTTDPIRKTIAVIDKAILEEEVSVNLSTYKNPNVVLKAVRGY